MTQNSKKYTMYCYALEYLLFMYATEDVIAEGRAEITKVRVTEVLDCRNIFESFTGRRFTLWSCLWRGTSLSIVYWRPACLIQSIKENVLDIV